MPVVEALRYIERGTKVVALTVLLLNGGIIVAVYDAKVGGGVLPVSAGVDRDTEKGFCDGALVVVAQLAI